MITDFDIYHYISTHLNDKFQNIIDQRIEFIKKHQHLFFKGEGYHTLPYRKEEKTVELSNSNGDLFEYKFSGDEERKLISVYVRFKNTRPLITLSSNLPFFDITKLIPINLLDTKFIFLDESKLLSDMLLGNVKSLLPIFYPDEYQKENYSFDLVEWGAYYYFRVKIDINDYTRYWRGNPISYSNIGYELGKYFHLFVTDLREIRSIVREDVGFLINRMRGED